MNSQAVSLGIALLVVPAVLIGWAIATHNLRVRRVRRLARSLPVGTRERILARITDAAREASVCTLLVPDRCSIDESPSEQRPQPDNTASRFGGIPYGEAGEQWPTRDDKSPDPTDFLIQVRLGEPLPSPWLGRLIVVFWRFDEDQTVRIYSDPSPAKYVCRPGSPDASPERRLTPLPIPVDKSALISQAPEHGTAVESPAASHSFEVEWQLPYDPSLLLETVPGLRDELRRLTRHPADLLTHWLLTERHGYTIDLGDIVQMGGQPQWVQDDPGPMTCMKCERPLRFLFQFGDLSGQSRFGDAGVCFVFGCDAHPETARSLVQMC